MLSQRPKIMNLNYRVIIGFILCFTGIHLSAQTTVAQKIDSIGIFIGQQAHITIEVTTHQGAKILFPALKPLNYIVPGVELLEVSEADTSSLDNNQIKVSKCYTITSFDEKLYAIPGLKVKIDGKEFAGNTLAFKVVTMDVDTLHLNQFFPAKDVQDNPFSWKEWSPIFWMSIVILILCLFAFYLFLRLRDHKPIVTKIRIIKKVLPHQKALQAIDNIKAEKLTTSTNQKIYYTQLTDTLREYINERFGFNAMEMTSSEIIYQLKAKGDQKMIDELKNLFETADLVKFAKYETMINENDMNLVNAIHFIDETKLEGLPTEEKIVPKLDEKDKRIQKNRITIKSLLWTIAIIVTLIMIYIIYYTYKLLS